MARRYASVPTGRWSRDGEFRQLPRDAQWLYGLLETQPEISACGAIPLRVRRWAAMASDCTEQVIWDALKVLDAAQLVVVDDDTEEVLIRTFVEQDGGHSNPRRLPSIRDAANAVESPRVVRALAAELDRLGVGAQWRGQASIECLSVGIPVAYREASECHELAAREGAGVPDSNAVPHDEISQVNSHSIGKTTSIECLTDEQRRVPQPTTHNPQPEDLRSSLGSQGSPDNTGSGKTRRGTRIPDDFTATPQMIEWARINTPNVGQSETADFRDYWQAESGAKSTKLNWVKAWQVWMRREQKRVAAQIARDARYARPREQPASTAPTRIPEDERCPEHTSYRKATCGLCRARRLAQGDTQ